mgnify:CR=1 FL=1
MKIYAVEYDFNIITIKCEKKPPEHRVETFTNPHDFIARVKQLEEVTYEMHEAMGEKVNTNIKTYGGELKEIPLKKVLDPFGAG